MLIGPKNNEALVAMSIVNISIFVSEYHSPLKRTRDAWRNDWVQGLGRKSAKWAENTPLWKNIRKCSIIKWKWKWSHVWLFVTPWTVTYQAPPSMGFSRQEYWSGLPFPSPGDFSQPRDWTWVSHLAGRRFNLWATREAHGRKWRVTKKPLDESERGDWKSWLKAQHSEN